MSKQYHCEDCGTKIPGKYHCCCQCDEYFERIECSYEGLSKEERAVAEKEEKFARSIILGALRGAVRTAEIEKEMEEVHAREALEVFHLEPIYGTGLSTFADGLVVQHMMGVAEEVL